MGSIPWGQWGQWGHPMGPMVGPLDWPLAYRCPPTTTTIQHRPMVPIGGKPIGIGPIGTHRYYGTYPIGSIGLNGPYGTYGGQWGGLETVDRRHWSQWRLWGQWWPHIEKGVPIVTDRDPYLIGANVQGEIHPGHWLVLCSCLNLINRRSIFYTLIFKFSNSFFFCGGVYRNPVGGLAI